MWAFISLFILLNLKFECQKRPIKHLYFEKSSRKQSGTHAHAQFDPRSKRKSAFCGDVWKA